MSFFPASPGGNNQFRNLAKKADIAPIFDTTVAYAVGDLCYYDGILYEFTSVHAVGAWNSAEVEVKKISEKIEELESNFQDGVDAVYDAVVAKGSTPASHSLSDVVDGIAAIPTGITPSGTIDITANGAGQDVASYAYADVNVPNSNSATFTANSRASAIDMGATNDYRYVNTSGVPNSNSTTYDATTRSSKIDLGADNTYRYLKTNSVPNSNSATYTTTTREKKDLGATNTYRYVNTSNMPNVNSTTYTAITRSSKIDLGAANTYRYLVTSDVPNSNSTTYTYGSGSTGATVNMGSTNTYRYVNATNVYNKGKTDGRSFSSQKKTFTVPKGGERWETLTATCTFATKIVGISSYDNGSVPWNNVMSITFSGNTITAMVDAQEHDYSWTFDVTAIGY